MGRERDDETSKARCLGRLEAPTINLFGSFEDVSGQAGYNYRSMHSDVSSSLICIMGFEIETFISAFKDGSVAIFQLLDRFTVRSHHATLQAPLSTSRFTWARPFITVAAHFRIAMDRFQDRQWYQSAKSDAFNDQHARRCHRPSMLATSKLRASVIVVSKTDFSYFGVGGKSELIQISQRSISIMLDFVVILT